MRRLGGAILVLILMGPAAAAATPPASADSSSRPALPAGGRLRTPGEIPVFDVPDTVQVEARRSPWSGRHPEFVYDYLNPAGAERFAWRPAFTRDPVPRPRVIRLSRFSCVARGADRGAFGGLSVGTVGNWLGLWDEKTAWAIMGAGAAAGAIWGGTAGAADDGFRLRPVWTR